MVTLSELYYIGQNISEVPKEVTKVEVDHETEEIRERAFEECHHLRSVTFADNGCLEAIEFHAFFGCKLLEEISLPSTMTYIGYGAFGDCHSLVAVNLPAGLAGIMHRTFYFCESLKTISIPSSVEWIGQQAFEGCISLEAVNFSSTSGLTKIGRWTFSDCSSLRSFDMPSTVRVIDGETFRRCTNLVNLNLPEGGLCEIFALAFWGCESLTSVRIPSCVEIIGMFAFLDCTSLLSVELARNGKLAVVEDRAFEGCTSLVNLWSPATEVQTFSNCTALNLLLPEEDGAEMTKVLASRFDTLPLHGASYFDVFELGLKDAVFSDDENGFTADLRDRLGMNVYHILALSTKQDTSAFELLSRRISKNLFNEKDRNGCTPMDYLFSNLSADTERTVEFVVNTTIAECIPYLGLSRWREDIELLLRSFRQVNRRGQRAVFRQLRSKFELYQRKETLSLLDLAVWKAQFKQVAHLPGGRKDCRINCGADIVISHVMHYLPLIE